MDFLDFTSCFVDFYQKNSFKFRNTTKYYEI